jgi:hypothetical protein
MKKKTAKQPKAVSPATTVQLKDLKPKKNPKGGGEPTIKGTFNFRINPG